MRCQSCAGTTRLTDAVAELATFLKQIAPNQLIADGGDGFDDDPTPYVGLTNLYAVRGDEGASFSQARARRRAGHAELPLLPAELRLRDGARRRDLDRAPPGHRPLTGKVAYLGECGFAAPDAERAQSYDAWLRHLFDRGGGQLGLFWQLSPASRANNDGFAVYSRRDNATAWILPRWGKQIR